MMIDLFVGVLKIVRQALNVARLLYPANFRRERQAMTARLRAISRLDAFSRGDSDTQVPYAKNVLIDGMWDNPNYWMRYALTRRALGLAQSRETGLIGRYSRRKAQTNFASLGITKLVDFAKEAKYSETHLAEARRLLTGARTPDDLLRLAMPYGFPMTVVFDGILKRQRRATVDMTDLELPIYVAEALACLDAADSIIDRGGFDLVALSHGQDYTYVSIAWAAIRRQIPVILLYGDFGTARFSRVKTNADLFPYYGRPTKGEMDGMQYEVKRHLRSQGSTQLAARFNGKTDDVGAVYAYQHRRRFINKALIAECFGWDSSKPVIGVYNSNWFDYPHGSGLHYFRDFLDWIEQTLAIAREHDGVNWLFKPHPCDDWYASINGIRLEEMINATNLPHIRLVDKSWNGAELIRSLDGIVTCHGTIGVEATALGTPVLVPYSGWYGHVGFVTNPGNRDGYLTTLKTDWWNGVDRESNRAKAELFAGWMFCVPEWQGSYLLKDDSKQEAIYRDLPEFLDANTSIMERESHELRDWFESGHPYFHIFKMARSQSFLTTT
jgi:hypothetical protein